MTGPAALSTRGLTTCRGCGAETIQPILDLHSQPLANELLTEQDQEQESFPLELRICTTCGLGQVGEYVPPNRIFGDDYPYLSSVSTSWVAHAQRYAALAQQRLDLGSSDYVLEIASNDGYLLREFLDLRISVLGVEPASTIAELARSRGVETRNVFFGRDTAANIVAERGHPRLIVANNVLAHVPDLDDFVGGLSLLCGPDTVVSVENPGFLGLMQQTQFDTIYHEHFSYLSAHAVQKIGARHGLTLFQTEVLATHGGSYRYWLAADGTAAVTPSVQDSIRGELNGGLLSPQCWSDFAQRSQEIIAALRDWLDTRAASGTPIAGYGAAAKGNTLLNAAGVGRQHLSVVVDGSSEKWGKFLPGSRVPIIKPADFAAYDPAQVLILPWNIAQEIAGVVAELVPKAQCWVAVPSLMALSQA